MKSTTEKGREAEGKAADFLLQLGYVIVHRRYKRGRGEIDIIALDGETLVFVEVKARRSSDPTESVTPGKASRIKEAALAYLAEMGLENKPLRFDLIAIESGAIRHYPGFIIGED